MTIKVGDMFLQQIRNYPQITIVIEVTDKIVKYKEIDKKGVVFSGQLGKNIFETWVDRYSLRLTE